MLFDKKFDLIVSLGEDCACTSYLRRFNLQDYSYPFDWLTKASFETRIDLIVNNFENFLIKENLVKMEKPQTGADEKHEYYHDKKLDFFFYHDFECTFEGENEEESFEKQYLSVKDKYNRRINRFYRQIDKSNNILFVWWSRDKIQPKDIIENGYEKLISKFKDKNVYILLIEYSPEYKEVYLKDKHVLAVQYDNISYQANPKWNETMGNEENNTKLFKNIKRIRSIKNLAVFFVWKILKFFISLIPIKNIRNNIKEKIEFKFFRNRL